MLEVSIVSLRILKEPKNQRTHYENQRTHRRPLLLGSLLGNTNTLLVINLYDVFSVQMVIIECFQRYYMSYESSKET